jgi:hypothetical protein
LRCSFRNSLSNSGAGVTALANGNRAKHADNRAIATTPRGSARPGFLPSTQIPVYVSILRVGFLLLLH